MRIALSLALLSLAATGLRPIQASENDDVWKQLSRELEVRSVQLASLISQANAKAINTDYATVSRQVITAFEVAAKHDRENVDQVRRIFKTFGYYAKTDPAEADRLAANELAACIQVADHAIAELRQQLDGKITLTDPPDFSIGKMDLGPGYYHLDGRIVFPGTITWMPKDEGMLQAFGRMGGGYYQLSSLKEDGTVSDRTLSSNADSARSQQARNMAPFSFFIGHAPAGWMVNRHPETLHGARHFTKYDIDSPLVRDCLQKLFQGILPQWSKACGDLTRMHLLANEPHFATQKGGWRADNGLSDHTMRKYRDWIAAKYGTVGALNASYGTAYERLDQVAFCQDDPELDQQNQYKARQIDPALRGGPVWYDWCRFNMDRVNDWFTFLKQQVQAADPNRSPVTIKMLGFTLSRNMRDGGMDIEYLTKLQDITGADLRVAPRDAIFYGKYEEGRDPETGWVSRYAYDWVEQSMYLDFTKSLCPNKVFYDSEWHGFGAVSWRHFQLKRDYVRSSLWMAFTHGMGAIQPWLWGRESDGSLRSGADHIGELSTQPVALDAYGRVMKELNAHAERVVTAVPRERLFMIYYCEESAIQDDQYTGDFKDVYESLKLLNLPVGFTTPSEIAGLDPQKQTVIVSPTRFISDNSLKELRDFKRLGGRVVMVRAKDSFLKDEMGAARSGDTIKNPFAALPLSNVVQLAEDLDAALASLQPLAPMDLQITDSRGAKAYGVIIAWAIDPQTGEVSVVLNNVSKDRRVVTFKPRQRQADKLMDLITQQPEQAQFVMEPCGVRLLRGSSEQ